MKCMHALFHFSMQHVLMTHEIFYTNTMLCMLRICQVSHYFSDVRWICQHCQLALQHQEDGI